MTPTTRHYCQNKRFELNFFCWYSGSLWPKSRLKVLVGRNIFKAESQSINLDTIDEWNQLFLMDIYCIQTILFSSLRLWLPGQKSWSKVFNGKTQHISGGFIIHIWQSGQKAFVSEFTQRNLCEWRANTPMKLVLRTNWKPFLGKASKKQVFI